MKSAERLLSHFASKRAICFETGILSFTNKSLLRVPTKWDTVPGAGVQRGRGCEIRGNGPLSFNITSGQREDHAVEGPSLWRGLWAGKLPSGDLKGCHQEGAEAMSYVTQRTEVRAVGGCFRKINLCSAWERIFLPSELPRCGVSDLASSKWVLEGHLLGIRWQIPSPSERWSSIASDSGSPIHQKYCIHWYFTIVCGPKLFLYLCIK